MAKIYTHLSTQERAVVMTMRADQCSMRSIAKSLCRSATTISREIKRTSGSRAWVAPELDRLGRRFLVQITTFIDIDQGCQEAASWFADGGLRTRKMAPRTEPLE